MQIILRSKTIFEVKITFLCLGPRNLGFFSYLWWWVRLKLRWRSGIWPTWRLILTWRWMWRYFLLSPGALVLSCFFHSSEFLTPYRPADWHRRFAHLEVLSKLNMMLFERNAIPIQAGVSQGGKIDSTLKKNYKYLNQKYWFSLNLFKSINLKISVRLLAEYLFATKMLLATNLVLSESFFLLNGSIFLRNIFFATG